MAQHGTDYAYIAVLIRSWYAEYVNRPHLSDIFWYLHIKMKYFVRDMNMKQIILPFIHIQMSTLWMLFFVSIRNGYAWKEFMCSLHNTTGLCVFLKLDCKCIKSDCKFILFCFHNKYMYDATKHMMAMVNFLHMHGIIWLHINCPTVILSISCLLRLYHVLTLSRYRLGIEL